MDLKKFIAAGKSSKTFKLVLGIIIALIILLLVFKAGEFVGFRKANFSYKWGENYHRNFGGPSGGFFGNLKRGFGERDLINSHGTFGSIIKIDMTSSTGQFVFVIKGSDNVEKTVNVSDKITINGRGENIEISDLKVDDRVAVIGSPNEQGQIDAKFIRLFR